MKKKTLKTLAGILGALLGALLGIGIILLLDLFGYENVDCSIPQKPGFEAYFSYGFWIHALTSGISFSILTMWLCKKCSGQFFPATMAVCSVLLLVVPFFADWAAWAITSISSYSGVYSLAHYFRLVPAHIQWRVGFPRHLLIDAELYISNLVTLYTGVIVGVVGFHLLQRIRRKM